MHYPLAYIDAGTSSLIIQSIIAAVLVGPYLLRKQIRRAIRLFRRDDDSPTS